MCSFKNRLLKMLNQIGVLKNFGKFAGKNFCWKYFLTYSKHKCFSENFCEVFIRTPFLQTSFGRLLLLLWDYWWQYCICINDTKDFIDQIMCSCSEIESLFPQWLFSISDLSGGYFLPPPFRCFRLVRHWGGEFLVGWSHCAHVLTGA